MTDKELLELAAKAAGITGWQSKHGYWNMKDIDGLGVVCCSSWTKFSPDTGEKLNPMFADAIEELSWDPLTDDGDALRMAVKLGMLVSFEPPTESGAVCRVVTDWDAETGYPKVSATEQHNSDPYAATRRAIVRAAAEIWKGMK